MHNYRASYATRGPEGVRWSTVLDEYANLLIQTDLDQDKSLVALVRMQLIINQMQSMNLMGSNANQELRELYTSTLRSQLQAIIGSEKLGPAASTHRKCTVLTMVLVTCMLSIINIHDP